MRPLRILLLLLLAFASMPLAASPAADTLAADSEARWVPFQLTTGNQIRFRALMDGRWVDAMLDTGLSDTAVSASFARAAGMKPLVQAHADAIGGAIPLAWTGLGRVEIGGLVRTGGRIAIITADPRATGPDAVDLFVGGDLLAGHALDIDYAARRFRLLPSGRMPFRGVTMPLRLAGSNNLYLTELAIGVRVQRGVIVDTGDGAMLTLTRSTWRNSGAQAGPVTSAVAYGAGGRVETDLVLLPDLRLGTLPPQTAELRIEGDTGFTARKGAAGRIGGGLLRRHRVLLDPRAGRMILAVNDAAWQPSRSTSGLMTAQDGRRLKVLHVMRGSPAAATGWTAGAEICAVDGAAIPSAYATSAVAGWSVGTPGRVVQLDLCDGNRRSLTLARFY
ncbi:aspartyl protease family protein [Sphingomonas turrisvirgatae]|uniref:PDZ domain-containing protein n=1 Tax=Sphingomonas turrisvirgatae TaxID=1888892 RepID=A0A1E3LSF1_9SPHN|nr:aspartyl protease family protein [Sphingomonas turrisvirgatae]ODP36669.1 hypothetical protein BFL28_05020 [Sphingomonas turrisvirgatae]